MAQVEVREIAQFASLLKSLREQIFPPLLISPVWVQRVMS
jgi:hypothetical protein